MLRKWLNKNFGLEEPEDNPQGTPPDPESLDKNRIVHELQADVDRIEKYADDYGSYEEADEHGKNSILTGFLRLGERFSSIKKDSRHKYNDDQSEIEEFAKLDDSDMPEDTGGFRRKRNLIAHNYDTAYEEDVDEWIEDDLPYAQEEIDDYWLEEPEAEEYSYIDEDEQEEEYGQ